MVKDRGKMVRVEFVTRWSPGVQDGQKVTGGDGEMTTVDAARPSSTPRQWSFDHSPAEVLKLMGLKIVMLPDAITLQDIDIGHRLPGEKIQWAVAATIQRAIDAYDHARKERNK